MYDIKDILLRVFAYWERISTIWKIIDVLLCCLVAIIQFRSYKRKRIQLPQFIGSILLAGYVFLVFSSTILSRPLMEIRKIDLSFLKNLLFNLNHTIDSQIETVLNSVLLLPVGVLLTLCVTKIKWWQVFMCGFLMSFSIEIIQYVTKRGTFELTDLIENSIGALLGYMICRFIKKYY